MGELAYLEWGHRERVLQAEVPTDTSASLEQATGAPDTSDSVVLTDEFVCSYETQNHFLTTSTLCFILL